MPGRLRLYGHCLLATLGALPPFRQGRGLPSLAELRPPRLILAGSSPGARRTGRVAYDTQPTGNRVDREKTGIFVPREAALSPSQAIDDAPTSHQ